MTRNAMPEKHQPTLEPLNEAIDHVRGPTAARLIVEYGDTNARTRVRRFEKSNGSSKA
jgi:hypothetical protein